MYLCGMNINEATWKYVRQHQDEDVRKLALQGVKDAEVNLTLALQQIAGRQTARRKLPSWATVDGIIYPPHLNMEQCSSEQTARYKSSLTTAFSPKGVGDESIYVDLTGGFGVDLYWMSQAFSRRIYVEQDAALCAVAEENFRQLGLECSVCCCDTATYLTKMEYADCVYLDPARRNEHGGRTYGIEDCTPNVLELLPLLMEKADSVILKLSPMLDWRKAVNDLNQHASVTHQPSADRCNIIRAVHIISVDNECKELVLVLDDNHHDTLRLCCVNNDSCFECVSSVETGRLEAANEVFPAGKHMEGSHHLVQGLYLYEPNASVMKAGCFTELAERFGTQQLSANSHLFVSADDIATFPGRRFQIQAVSSMNKHELSRALSSLKSANIAVRNFPLSVEQLRKKLKLKDGGDTYIFATTTANGEHRLLICRKIG